MVAFKNRFMVMEIFLDPNKDLGVDDPIIITGYNVEKAITDSLLLNFGECGLASALGSLSVQYVNPITKLCIIRSSRDDYQKVWCAITMVRSIGNCPVVFNLLDLSGSVRACKDAALGLEKAKFDQYKAVVGAGLTEELNQRMQSSMKKLSEY